MRKLIALFVCLMLLISPAYAAENVPEAVPTQAELGKNFFSDLNQFVSGTNLSENALKLELSANDQPVVTGTLEADGDVLNAEAVVDNIPFQFRFGEDAIYAYAKGQSYYIPYSNLAGIFSEIFGLPISISPDSRETIMRLYDAVLRNIITPGLTIEKSDESLHIVFDLNDEMLLALGDEILENPELRAMLSALSEDTDISETWAYLHGMLESGQFPITLHADIRSDASAKAIRASGNIGGVPVSVSVDLAESGVAFSIESLPFVEISGAGDYLTGDLECHADVAGAFTFGLSFTGSDKILSGQLTLPEGIVAELNGTPAENGYRIFLTVTQEDVTIATAEFLCTEAEDVSTAEIWVNSEDQTVFTGEFIYAKQTGAFSTWYDAMGIRSMEGSGMITAEETFGTLTFREGDAVNAVLSFSLVNNSNISGLSVTVDALTGDSMSRVFTLHAEYDKISQGFTGTCWIPQNHNRLEIQWIHKDSVWRLKASETKIGSVDATFLYDGNSLMGEFTGQVYGAGGSVTGNFLWSPCAKTLVLTTQLFRLNASLIQNGNGMPLDLKVSYQETRKPVYYEIKINRDEIYFSKAGKVTTISGAFKDENCCSVIITENAGRLGKEYHYYANIRADRDLLQIMVTDDAGEKLFEASLCHAEKGRIEFLYDEENAVELTPELADTLLNGRPKETVSQAEAVEGE